MRNLNLQLGSFFPLVWSESFIYGTGWTKQNGAGIYRVSTQTGIGDLHYKGTGHIRVSKDGKKVYFGRSIENGMAMVLIEREIAAGTEREVMRRQWFQGMAIAQDNQHLITAGIDPATNSRITLLVSLTSGRVRELQRTPSDVSPVDLTAWARGTKFWHAEWKSGGQSFLTLKRFHDETQEDEVWEVPIEGPPRMLAFHLPRTTLTYRLQPGGTKIVWATRLISEAGKRN